MALYSVLFEYTVYGEICQNRFHYASIAPGAVTNGANRLNIAWEDDVLPALASLQTLVGANIAYNRIYVVNLYDPADFAENSAPVPVAPTGTHGAVMPTFVALSVTSPRYRVGKNRWSKRLAGIGEDDVGGNVFTNVATLTAIADAMTSPIVHSVSAEVFNPVLLFLDPGSTPPYQIYPTEAGQRSEMAPVESWAYFELTTQRSRKSGVGI